MKYGTTRNRGPHHPARAKRATGTEKPTPPPAAQAIGYAAATHFAEWRRSGVPVLALNAARGFLASIGVNAKMPIKRQFESDELIAIMGAVSRLTAADPDRSNIIKRLAREL